MSWRAVFSSSASASALGVQRREKGLSVLQVPLGGGPLRVDGCLPRFDGSLRGDGVLLRRLQRLGQRVALRAHFLGASLGVLPFPLGIRSLGVDGDRLSLRRGLRGDGLLLRRLERLGQRLALRARLFGLGLGVLPFPLGIRPLGLDGGRTRLRRSLRGGGALLRRLQRRGQRVACPRGFGGALDSLAVLAIELSGSLLKAVDRRTVGHGVGCVRVDLALSVCQLALNGRERLRRLRRYVTLARVVGLERGPVLTLALERLLQLCCLTTGPIGGSRASCRAAPAASSCRAASTPATRCCSAS